MVSRRRTRRQVQAPITVGDPRTRIALLTALAVLLCAAKAQDAAADATHDGPYWAIAGSFLNQSAAQSRAQEVARKSSMSPTVLVATTPSGPMHRVALGPWSADAEAVKAVRHLQEAGYADAWKLAGEGINDASKPGGEGIDAALGGGDARDSLGDEGVSPSDAPQGPTSSTPTQQQRVAARVVAPHALAGPRPSSLSFQSDIRATTVFGTTSAAPSKQKEEVSLIAGIRAQFDTPKPLGLSGFHVTTRIRREGSDALIPGKPASPSAVRHHLDAYAEAELRQAWAEIRRDDWRFRIGRQTVVWGKTRGLKVLDIVNPESYREFLLSSFELARTPLWMLNAERQVGQGTLQALLVLEREGHRLPRTGGVFAQALYADRPEAPGRSRYRDLEPGLRYSFAKAGWALTVNALRHRDDWPVWRRDETSGAPTAFEPRMTTLGASAAKTYGDYALRVETTLSDRRYFHGADDFQPSPELASVVSIGWTALADTRVDLQFFQTSALDHVPGMARDETEMTAVVHVERAFQGADLAASLTTHHGLSGQGALIRPRLTWRAAKALSLTAFADFFEGRQDAFYGQFDHRDRVGLTIHLAL